MAGCLVIPFLSRFELLFIRAKQVIMIKDYLLTYLLTSYLLTCLLTYLTGPRSAVGNVSGYRCVSDCRSRGREFDPGPVPYFRGD